MYALPQSGRGILYILLAENFWKYDILEMGSVE
jgi:hypothetical protein